MPRYIDDFRRKLNLTEPDSFITAPTPGVFTNGVPFIPGTGQLEGVDPATGAPVVNAAFGTNTAGVATSPIVSTTPQTLSTGQQTVLPSALPSTELTPEDSARVTRNRIYRDFINRNVQAVNKKVIDKNTRFSDLPLLERKRIEGSGSVQQRQRRAEKYDLAIERRLTREGALKNKQLEVNAKATGEQAKLKNEQELQKIKNEGLKAVELEKTEREKLKLLSQKDDLSKSLENALAIADKKIEEAKAKGDKSNELAAINNKFNIVLTAYNNKLEKLSGKPELIAGLTPPTLNNQGDEVRGGISRPYADTIRSTIIVKKSQGDNKTASILEQRLVQAGWNI